MLTSQTIDTILLSWPCTQQGSFWLILGLSLLWASFGWKCDYIDQSSMKIHSNMDKQYKCTCAFKCDQREKLVCYFNGTYCCNLVRSAVHSSSRSNIIFSDVSSSLRLHRSSACKGERYPLKINLEAHTTQTKCITFTVTGPTSI